MAPNTALERVIGVTSGAIALPIQLVGYTAREPLVSGALLFALTRAPEQYRSRLLKVLGDAGLSNERIAQLIKSLKYLLALGAVRKLHKTLTRFALNHYHFGKPGAPFKFGPGLKNELVVVTGGCSGFGYEMVKGFSKYARVIVLDMSPFPAELEKLPGVHYYQIDLTDASAIESTAEAIRREHGNPSVLVNNAGISTGTSVKDTDAVKNDRIFKVNLSSHLVLIKEFLPAMLDARKGHIVTIASMASFFATPGLVDYSCTKIGALYLHEGLRHELRLRYENGTCIQTTCVHPSWHSTGILKGYEDRLAKFGIVADPASNVSNAIVEQVLAGRSGQIFMPRDQESKTNMRNWPIYFQDLMFYLAKKRGLFQF